MIEQLKNNIQTEINILREISNFSRLYEIYKEKEKYLILSAIDALKKSIKIINNSIPALLSNTSSTKKLSTSKNIKTLEKVGFHSDNTNLLVTLNSKDKEVFLKELNIGSSLIKKLKKIKSENKPDSAETFEVSRGYLKVSNLMFRKLAYSLIKKGYFRGLSNEIQKSNLNILFETYVSTIILTTFIGFIFSIFLLIFLLFFQISFSPPYIESFSGEIFKRFFSLLWIPIAIPFVVLFLVYYYPISEKETLERKINQELPFAVIHMSSISGSGIEPTEIFKIIGLSREYPALRKEIRKVLNQVNLYGYDLVTALNNTSKITPSVSLSELFSGLSTTINSGGNLSDFFQKRAETLLHNYRLERDKFTKIAETFMDIYISVVLATPMILILLLVIINVAGISIGFSTIQLTLITILIITLINIIFLGVLHVKQPAY